MKSTELRIGNIIESRTKHPVKANWGTLRALENGEKTYFPIELNDDWFKKLGFFKDDGYWKKDAYNDADGWDIIIRILDVRKFFSNEHLYYNYTNGIVKIKYVHQLQNLFFALTGQELPCDGF